MKLFLALAGLLATLAMLQTSNSATPGNSARRRVPVGFSAQHLPFPWAVLLLLWGLMKGFGASPDLVIYALGSSPGGSGEFSGVELYGGGQAASGQSLQGAERKVRVPGPVQPWAKLFQVFWRKDK